MGRRSRAWILSVWAVVALGGCAQSTKTESPAAKPESTEGMVTRSADAMKRFWDDGKGVPAAEQKSVDAGANSAAPQSAGPAAQSAPTSRAPVVSQRPALPSNQQARVEPAAASAETPAPSERVAPPAVVAPVPDKALTAPTVTARAASGLAGFFDGAAVVVAADGAPKGPSLRIGTLALCSKIEGFGRFVRMESARITGKPVVLYVYTQVEGFAHRTIDGKADAPDNGKAQWVVDLGQTVVVYRLSADGKGPDEQVLYLPEQACRDVAMGKRRDHYLVQGIELSPWLVAGKYAVKVTVRDRATGMVDEQMSEIVLR